MSWQPMDTAPQSKTILVRRHNDVCFEYYIVWWGDADPIYPWRSDYSAYPADRLDGWHEIPDDEQNELVAFVAIWAVQFQKDHGLDGLHPTHYDLMMKHGARMVDFKRATNAHEAPFQTLS